MNDKHITFINNLIKLDLDNGPFITGSYVTWLIEKEIGYNQQWLHDD